MGRRKTGIERAMKKRAGARDQTDRKSHERKKRLGLFGRKLKEDRKKATEVFVGILDYASTLVSGEPFVYANLTFADANKDRVTYAENLARRLGKWEGMNDSERVKEATTFTQENIDSGILTVIPVVIGIIPRCRVYDNGRLEAIPADAPDAIHMKEHLENHMLLQGGEQ